MSEKLVLMSYEKDNWRKKYSLEFIGILWFVACLLGFAFGSQLSPFKSDFSFLAFFVGAVIGVMFACVVRWVDAPGKIKVERFVEVKV